MNLFVIIGEDDFLVTEEAKKIIGEDSDALEIIDSRASTSAELQLRDIAEADLSFSSPPFLSPMKITWWKNVDFLPSGGSKSCAEEVKKALEDFAKKLSTTPLAENQKFILTSSKLLQTSVFAKTIKSVTEIKLFSKAKYAKDQAIAAVVKANELALSLGLKFAPGATDFFVARVGFDTRSLMSELSKMRDFLGDKTEITRDDINTISSPGIGKEPEMWDVTDALGERNLAKVLTAIHPFEQQEAFPIFATTVIEKFFRQLVEIKDAEMSGKLSVATASLSPFAAQKMTRFARAWSIMELRSARAQFLSLREKAVSSSCDVGALIIITLANITPRNARA